MPGHASIHPVAGLSGSEHPTPCLECKWYRGGTRLWTSCEVNCPCFWIRGGYGAPGV